MPRGLPRIPREDGWVDLWTHLPESLKDYIRQMAIARGSSVLEIIEALLWQGLLRLEEVRRRRGRIPSVPNIPSQSSSPENS